MLYQCIFNLNNPIGCFIYLQNTSFTCTFHSPQSKYKNIQGNRAILLLCIGYNYNVYIITSSGFGKYSMTHSLGSSQCDPELAIPDIFRDMETNPSYQAIGSERQIFSLSVNKTYNQKRFRQQQNNQSKQQIHEIWSFTYPGVLRQGVTGQYKVIPNCLSFIFYW